MKRSAIVTPCQKAHCVQFVCVCGVICVFVMISWEQQQCVCVYVGLRVIGVITGPLFSPPWPLGKLPLCPGLLCRGRAALWWLLLSEWPSLLLIYSSPNTTSSGSLLIFTSTGDTGLLILTIMLQFMVMRTGRCTVLYTSERRVTWWHQLISFN